MGVLALTERVLAGERRALAKVISLVENGREGAADALGALYPHTGDAHRIGVTGPPGSGKSTLVNELALLVRQRDLTLGIVSVDPTSPFTGGAILGDRIRMRDLAGDPGIFIRSMATRGSLGGLARTTSDVVDVLDAAGFDMVFIETVGAGQSEVDIARAAHTTLVVEAPGLGDDIQAIKAGILEIADVLVINKADLPNADSAYRALTAMLHLNTSPPADVGHHGAHVEMADDGHAQAQAPDAVGWDVPVLKTVATEGEGVSELLDVIEQHRRYLAESGGLDARERARVSAGLEARLRQTLLEDLLARVGQEEMARLVEEVLQRRTDPQRAVDSLVRTAQEET